MHRVERVLITGANGQLGQEFIHFLETHPVQVVACSSKELDITQASAVKKLVQSKRIDTIINCAAYTKVDAAESKEGAQIAANVNNVAVSSLVKVCADLKLKLVHFSTDYVYDGKTSETDFYTEESTPRPLNQYGLTKLLGDNEILASSIDYLIVRVAWLAGQYGANYIQKIIEIASQSSELSVVNDQLSTPSFCHDVVERTWELLMMNQNGLYHVASSNACTRLAYTEAVIKRLGLYSTLKINEVATSSFNSAATRPLRTPMSTKKLSLALGRKMKSWQQLLDEHLDKVL